MEAADILGHKVDAHGRLSVDRERWQEAQPRLLDALNDLSGEPVGNLLAAVEQFGWEIQRKLERPTLLIDHTAGSGRWNEEHVLFLEALSAVGFAGTVRAEAVDEEIVVEYVLLGGTVTAKAASRVTVEDREEDENAATAAP